MPVHHRHQYSIAHVEDEIFDKKPGVVGIELSPEDYFKFLEVTSYLETEMKVAMITACDVGARVFLIDAKKAELEKMLKEEIDIGEETIWERFWERDWAGFFRMLRDRNPRLIEKANKILINERDRIMAENLLYLENKFPEKNIIAIIGSGHLEGLREQLDLLKRNKIEILNEPLEIPCEEIKLYD